MGFAPGFSIMHILLQEPGGQCDEMNQRLRGTGRGSDGCFLNGNSSAWACLGQLSMLLFRSVSVEPSPGPCQTPERSWGLEGAKGRGAVCRQKTGALAKVSAGHGDSAESLETGLTLGSPLGHRAKWDQ